MTSFIHLRPEHRRWRTDDEPDRDVALAASADLITERDFVLLLISLYRDYPALWKIKSKEYADKNKRSLALSSIVKALRVYKPAYTEDLLKKKNNALRTNFNKERKKIEQAQRSGASPDDVPKPSLYYYNELLFLSDQMCISDTESSLSSEVKHFLFTIQRYILLLSMFLND